MQPPRVATNQRGENVSGNVTPNDEGATAVEYALMLALIFAVIVTAVTLVGTTLAAAFDVAAGML